MPRLPASAPIFCSSSDVKDEDYIVAPPDIFSGDTCATPTPGDFLVGGIGTDSGSSTPRYLDSPSVESLTSKASPLATHHLMPDRHRSSSLTPKEAPGTSSLVQTTSSGISPQDDHSSVDTSSGDLGRVTCDSPSGRMLSILPSAQHNLKPSDKNLSDEFSEEIPDYSLTSMPSATSLGSQSNCSEEGTDM